MLDIDHDHFRLARRMLLLVFSNILSIENIERKSMYRACSSITMLDDYKIKIVQFMIVAQLRIIQPMLYENLVIVMKIIGHTKSN